jgi:hypothetical protein
MLAAKALHTNTQTCCDIRQSFCGQWLIVHGRSVGKLSAPLRVFATAAMKW